MGVVSNEELQWAMKVGGMIEQMLQNNPKGGPRIISMMLERAMNAEGFEPLLKKKFGHDPVADPQANWERLMYTPTKFKKKKDGTELTSEEKKNKVWNNIRLNNLLGDTFSAVGAIGGTIPAIMADQMDNTARASATRRQKDLYGETATGRAAAAASPMFRGLSALMPTLSGIAAHRFYQEAGDKRNAFLQALSDATFNNVTPPASYMHERRLAAEGAAPIAPQVPQMPQGGRR